MKCLHDEILKIKNHIIPKKVLYYNSQFIERTKDFDKLKIISQRIRNLFDDKMDNTKKSHETQLHRLKHLIKRKEDDLKIR